MLSHRACHTKRGAPAQPRMLAPRVSRQIIAALLNAVILLVVVVALVSHYSWNVAKWSHVGPLTLFAIWAMSSCYLGIPRASGRRLWSTRLATWTYWLEILGFGTMFFTLTVSGLQQGALLQTGQVPWIDTVDTIRPLWLIRTFGGAYERYIRQVRWKVIPGLY